MLVSGGTLCMAHRPHIQLLLPSKHVLGGAALACLLLGPAAQEDQQRGVRESLGRRGEEAGWAGRMDHGEPGATSKLPNSSQL